MSFGGLCAACGRQVEAEHAAYYVTGIEFTRDQGGANVIHNKMREPNWIAHKTCVADALAKKKRGISPEQEGLF